MAVLDDLGDEDDLAFLIIAFDVHYSPWLLSRALRGT
jgi:hypothetical protein